MASSFKPESSQRVPSVLSGQISEDGRQSYVDLFRGAAIRAMDGRGKDRTEVDTRNHKPSGRTSSARVPSDNGHTVMQNVPVRSTKVTHVHKGLSGTLPLGVTDDTPKRQE